jgi:hypothetical protein
METWSWRHGHGDMENANKLYDMCGFVGLRGGIWRKGGANGLWESGQLILSMALEWREVRTFALKATFPSKVFLHLKAQ